ncbi:Aspartokinase [Gaertneriomyces sp. JEL0708]|nr:Aspartokinase [Gaertneriomyces sp. JEL0708]
MARDEQRQIVVQKYGGTSVGTAERMLEVAEIIKNAARQQRVVVVLSAMSGKLKTQGTTSRLLEAAKHCLRCDAEPPSEELIDALEQTHLKEIRAAIPSHQTDILNDVLSDVTAEFTHLRSFLSAAAVIQEISPRSRDVIISVGEKLSARILTAVLQSQGLSAVYVNLENLVTEKFEEKSIGQSFYDHIARRLAETISLLAPDETTIPVVTGYLGPVPGGILTTIGRGYTDLTAALVAVGLRAQELQIWKEVDGIFTADPRKAPKALLLPSITPEEAAELTYYGSEVIHPFTMEQVIRASIPIRIKNTFKPSNAGTVILPQPVTPPASPTHPPTDVTHLPRRPTAVTLKDDITVLNLHSNRKSVSHGFFAQIFLTLDHHNITVDLISTSEVHVSMALSPHTSPVKLERAISELRKHCTVDVMHNMAIVSLVGRRMRNSPGVAGTMFQTLAREGVNIEMISQGASEINISCVVDGAEAQKALAAIHDVCILGEDLENTTNGVHAV